MKKCATLLAAVHLDGALTPAPPAEGASRHVGWATTGRRGIEHRAPACGDRALDGEKRLTELRGNSRRAEIPSGYRWEISVDGRLYRSEWEPVPAGRFGAGVVFPDDSRGRFRVRMRIRTVTAPLLVTDGNPLPRRLPRVRAVKKSIVFRRRRPRSTRPARLTCAKAKDRNPTDRANRDARSQRRNSHPKKLSSPGPPSQRSMSAPPYRSSISAPP